MPTAEMPEHTVLVLVIDGLRAQDTTKMPYLTTLGSSGVHYTNACTVVPSLTLPAAASLSTGHHPVDVGIAGNTLWDSDTLINTGDPEQLEILRRSRHGRLLPPPTLAEHLLEAGMSVAAVGTGSNGCSLLLNPEAPSGLGLVIGTRPHGSSPLFVAPPDLLDDVAAHHQETDESRLQWAVRLIRDFVMPQRAPELLFVWIGELDYVQHDHGVNTDTGDQVLAAIDTAIEALVTNLRSSIQNVDVIVTADHGFSDATGTVVAEHIESQLPPELTGRAHFAYNNGALLVFEDGTMDPRQREDLVAWILDQPWSGAVLSDAKVPGSLPLSLISSLTKTPARPVAYVSLTSTNSRGEQQVLHASHDGAETLPGGHGSTSAADMAIPLILNGPGFGTHTAIDFPADILDIAPTLLHLLGVKPLTPLPGRVLTEALPEAATPSPSPAEPMTSIRAADDASTAHIEVFAGRRYVRTIERVKPLFGAPRYQTSRDPDPAESGH